MLPGQKRPRPEGDDQGDSERDNIKYKPPADPLELEAQLKEMIPLPHVSKRQWDEWYTRYVESNKTAQFLKAQKDSAAVEKNINTTFVLEFKQWLQGRSRWNVEVRPDGYRRCTPWGPQNLFFLPGVTDYLRSYLGKKAAYQLKLALLYMRGPRDLNEAFIYYKFLVRGDELENENGYLDDTLEYFPWGKTFQMYSGLKNGVDSGNGLGWPTNKQAAEQDLADAELRSDLVARDSDVILATKLNISPEEARQLVDSLSSSINVLAQYSPNSKEVLTQAQALLGAVSGDENRISTRNIRVITQHLGSLNNDLMPEIDWDKYSYRRLHGWELEAGEYNEQMGGMVNKLADAVGEDAAEEIVDRVRAEVVEMTRDSGLSEARIASIFGARLSTELNEVVPDSGVFDSAGDLVDLYNHPDRYGDGFREDLRRKANQLIRKQMPREEDRDEEPDIKKEEEEEEESSGSKGSIFGRVGSMISGLLGGRKEEARERAVRREKQERKAKKEEEKRKKQEEARLKEMAVQKAFDATTVDKESAVAKKAFDDIMITSAIARSIPGSTDKRYALYGVDRIAFIVDAMDAVRAVNLDYYTNEPTFHNNPKYLEEAGKFLRAKGDEVTVDEVMKSFNSRVAEFKNLLELVRTSPDLPQSQRFAEHVHMREMETRDHQRRQPHRQLPPAQTDVAAKAPQLTAPEEQPRLTAPVDQPRLTAPTEPLQLTAPDDQPRPAVSTEPILLPAAQATDPPQTLMGRAKALFNSEKYAISIPGFKEMPENIQRDYARYAELQLPPVRAAIDAADALVEQAAMSDDPAQKQYFAKHAESLLSILEYRDVHVMSRLRDLFDYIPVLEPDEKMDEAIARNLPNVIRLWAKEKAKNRPKRISMVKEGVNSPKKGKSIRYEPQASVEPAPGAKPVIVPTKTTEATGGVGVKRLETPVPDYPPMTTQHPDPFTGDEPEQAITGRNEFYDTREQHDPDLANMIEQTKETTALNLERTTAYRYAKEELEKSRDALLAAARRLEALKKNKTANQSPRKHQGSQSLIAKEVINEKLQPILSRLNKPDLLSPETQPLPGKSQFHQRTPESLQSIARGHAENIASKLFKELPFSPQNNGKEPRADTASEMVANIDRFLETAEEFVYHEKQREPELTDRVVAHIARITHGLNQIYSAAKEGGIHLPTQTQLRTSVYHDIHEQSQIMFAQIETYLRANENVKALRPRVDTMFRPYTRVMADAASMVGADTRIAPEDRRAFPWELKIVYPEADTEELKKRKK